MHAIGRRSAQQQARVKERSRKIVSQRNRVIAPVAQYVNRRLALKKVNIFHITMKKMADEGVEQLEINTTLLQMLIQQQNHPVVFERPALRSFLVSFLRECHSIKQE